VAPALLRIRQDFIGFIEFFESFLGCLVPWIDIRVMLFARELTIPPEWLLQWQRLHLAQSAAKAQIASAQRAFQSPFPRQLPEFGNQGSGHPVGRNLRD
jgi:hypothetical protein